MILYVFVVVFQFRRNSSSFPLSRTECWSIKKLFVPSVTSGLRTWYLVPIPLAATLHQSLSIITARKSSLNSKITIARRVREDIQRNNQFEAMHNVQRFQTHAAIRLDHLNLIKLVSHLKQFTLEILFVYHVNLRGRPFRVPKTHSNQHEIHSRVKTRQDHCNLFTNFLRINYHFSFLSVLVFYCFLRRNRWTFKEFKLRGVTVNELGLVYAKVSECELRRFKP